MGWWERQGKLVPVVRGDEYLQKMDRPGLSVGWCCSRHSYIRPVTVLNRGETYFACEQCIRFSEDMGVLEDNGVEPIEEFFVSA